MHPLMTPHKRPIFQEICLGQIAPVRSLLAVGSVVFLCVGCASRTAGYPDLGLVSGSVTLDEKPIGGIDVLFQPLQGRSSSGTTDRDGRYELRFSPVALGAAVGQHTVSFHYTPDEADVGAMTRPLKHLRKTFEVDVQSGVNTHDFELGAASP
jgi:hypothetical protein